MSDMRDIHNCVICEKRLPVDRDHVDTCKGACYQKLLRRQREYQPKTGQRCGCKLGVYQDNCPACEGTGWRIDFAKIRAASCR